VEDTVRGGPRFVGFNTHNSCTGGSVMSSIPDTADDGTVSVEESFVGCAMPLVLLTVHGGGHTWPDGQQYLSKNRVGVVEKDFNGNERIWQFFRGLSRP
jgi:polyhydroxybutyrate depolymerase